MPTSRTYRIIFTTFLLLTLIVQTFSALGIMADYWLRTEQYAQRCVNKSRPAMKCHGKCQMMRKMAEQEKQDQSMPDRKPEWGNDIWCFAPGMDAVETVGYADQLNTIAWYSSIRQAINSQNLIPVFHPPRALAV